MANKGRLSKLTVKKVGNWRGAIDFLGKSGFEVKKEVNKASFQLCTKLKNIVIGHLLAQDLNWKDLHPSTIKNKKSKNRNNKLIDTELYLSNIKVWRELGTAYVGVKKGISHKRGDNVISLDRLAIFLELGTSRMPARPLWNPSIEELGGEKGIKNFIASAIYKRLETLSKGTPLTITKKDIIKSAR